MGKAPDLYNMSFSGNERDALFMNDGAGHFEDRGYQARVDLRGDGRAQVWADLDGDGDLDLVVRQLQTPKVVVLRNDGNGNGSIEVSLVGTRTNRMGLGAQVKACVEGKCQVQQIHDGSGFESAGPALAHFGIGGAKEATVSVTWPTGDVQEVGVVPAGTKLRATEGKPGFEALHQPPFALGPPSPPPAALTSLAEAAGPGGAGAALAAAVKSGKPTLVNLWASWCVPCREEAPEFTAFSKSQGEKVATVGLAMEPDLEKDRAAAQKLGITWPLAAANPAQQAILDRALDGIDLPTTLAFDAKGALVDVVVGKASPEDLARLAREAGVSP